MRAEIARLTALQDRLLAMAERAGPTPAEAVADALREAGRLAPGSCLAPAESAATELIDALHPAGVAGVVEAMSPMLADRGRADRFAELVQQVQQLPEDLDDEHLDRLVGELVGLLPRIDPAPVTVDLPTLEKLLGHRLSDVQRRFHRRMRTALAGAR